MQPRGIVLEAHPVSMLGVAGGVRMGWSSPADCKAGEKKIKDPKSRIEIPSSAKFGQQTKDLNILVTSFIKSLNARENLILVVNNWTEICWNGGIS